MDQSLQKQVLRAVWVVLCTAVACALVYVLFPLTYPFLLAWVLAYIMNPFVNMLQRRARLPRWFAVTLALIVYLGVLVGLITLLVTNLVVEIGSLVTQIEENLDMWVQTIVDYVQSDVIQSIVERVSGFYEQNPQYQNTINNNLNSTAAQLADFGSALVGSIFAGVVGFITSLPNKATVAIISILSAFFMSKDWYKIQTRMAGWIPAKVRKTWGTIWTDLRKALFGYVRAQLILISITAVVIMIGLAVIGVNNAIAIGLLIGLCDLMPYLGVGAAMVPWTIYMFLQGDYYLGIGLAVLYGIVLVARQLIEPKVLATSLGLEPLPLIIALFIGLKLFGVIGLIIGPVTLIILFAISRAGVFRDVWSYIVRGKHTE